MEDYLGLVMFLFDESLNSAEMAFLPLRHQRRQKFKPSSQFLDLERLESRAAKSKSLPGQCVSVIVVSMGRVVGSVLLLAFYNYVGNSEILE